MKFRIGIVGPEESKWKKPEQIFDAKSAIKSILEGCSGKHRNLYLKALPAEKRADIVLVSGQCPKGGVGIWAEEIADNLGVNKEIFPAEVDQWNDLRSYGELGDKLGKDVPARALKGYRSRNIQIAEACDILYCIVPKVEPKRVECDHSPEGFVLKHALCIHCRKIGHSTNGGCWTHKYFRQHFPNKESRLVVI